MKNLDINEVASDNPQVTFDQFVERSRTQAVRTITLKLKGDADAAEDVVVESYLRMHASWGPNARRRWKECWSFLNKGIGWSVAKYWNARKTESLDALLEDHGYEPSVAATDSVSDTLVVLRDLMAKLPEVDRLTLEMEAEGYSAAEIAEQVNKSVQSVRIRLAKLREWLAQAFYAASADPPPAQAISSDSYSAQRTAAIIGRKLYWVLVRLKLLGAPYALKRTGGTYVWPHVSAYVVRRLSKLSKEERFADHTALTPSERNCLQDPPPCTEAYLTSKQICLLTGRSEGWVRRRLVPFLKQAEFRKSTHGGGIWLHFPYGAYLALKREIESYVPADLWMTAGGIAAALDRHVKWVEWRLPELAKRLGVRSEERVLDGIGRRAACWPPSVFTALREEAERTPDRENWPSIASLQRKTGKDWEWVKRQLDEIGAEPKPLRIPGSGKIFPHYPPVVEQEIVRRAALVERALSGWLTADGLEIAVKKSHSWISSQLRTYGKEECRTYGDDNMVPRVFYGPSVVAKLRENALKANGLPKKGEYLAVAEIAEALSKSQGWTRKQIEQQKIRGSKRRNTFGHIRTYYSPRVVERLRKLIP